ncbi:amino acid ABC transporter permease [Peterkaempfera bronchialis]|uniref:Amino acid ABC transporter permease n=1 Tax=Peterkaempfera bronchialis TaxID=2126346 RepID=A0A345SR90_9ACTN|nr:amino acid ABC transporter permease [Peterkaempfera bronchialis]AXI76245.1 amino acid ABC transporter permease [Peterkaempfera bronchialis]
MADTRTSRREPAVAELPDAQEPSPARPLSTAKYLGSAAVLALLAVVLCYQFVGTALTPAGPLHLLLGIVLPVLLLGGPLLAAYRRSKLSDREWDERRYTEARVSAARSRNASISSLGLTGFVAVVALVGLLVFTNDGAVQKTFFNVDFMTGSLVDIFKALVVNVEIAVGAQILAMAFGLLLAIGRLLPDKGFWPVRALSIAYIDIFRGIPSVVLIYLVCFGLPLTDVPVLSKGDPVVYAIVALALTYSAYNAELYRAGIESINKGQTSAALSMGLSQADVLRFVILPQMSRNIAAPMLSQFIGLQKDTALVIVVGIIDAFSQAKIYSANDFNLSAVTAVCFVFVLITIPQTRFVDYLLARSGTKLKKV